MSLSFQYISSPFIIFSFILLRHWLAHCLAIDAAAIFIDYHWIDRIFSSSLIISSLRHYDAFHISFRHWYADTFFHYVFFSLRCHYIDRDDIIGFLHAIFFIAFTLFSHYATYRQFRPLNTHWIRHFTYFIRHWPLILIHYYDIFAIVFAGIIIDLSLRH